MKKKKILLLTSIASVATFSAAAVLFSNRSNLGIKADDELNYNNYTLDLTKENLSGVEIDEVNSKISFTLSNNYYFEGTDTARNIMTTTSDTYIQCTNISNVDFSNANNIFEIEDGGDIFLQIDFRFVKRATINYDMSFVMIEEDNDGTEDTFYEVEEEDKTEPYILHYVFDHSRNYFSLDYIHIEFSCPA